MKLQSLLSRRSSRFLTSKMASSIKTFIFVDLETTGLPSIEYNRTKITELCAVAVQADHLELGVFPRVCNKLSLCFNPNKMIDPTATELTGLSNFLLEHQRRFTGETVDMLNNFLEMHQGPICFVAHNGNYFDYPILRAEIENSGKKLNQDIYCIDSLQAFRELDHRGADVAMEAEEMPPEFNDGYNELLIQACEEFERELEKNETKQFICKAQKINETTPKKQIIDIRSSNGAKKQFSTVINKNTNYKMSYKLQDIYSRLLSKPPIEAHEAEGDVRMLITVAAVYGEKFVAYANEKAKNFLEIPKMTVGRKIGT